MAQFDRLTTGFEGFPNRVRSTPVPNPVFGPLLEQIDDLAELKVTLRVIWLLHEKKGFPRFLTLDELLSDRTLVTALSTDGQPDHERVERALAKAVERGTLISGIAEREGESRPIFILNTESARNALARERDRVSQSPVPNPQSPIPSPQSPPWEAATERPNIYVLYEDNIGMLSPMIAEELREAEDVYPTAWIEDAFREAVAQNKRSWRYIARILERWEREGRRDGKSGRHSQKKAGYY
ncbi:MAG: DnaD domain-containing protein [Ardenticatenaceae bacterium]